MIGFESLGGAYYAEVSVIAPNAFELEAAEPLQDMIERVLHDEGVYDPMSRFIGAQAIAIGEHCTPREATAFALAALRDSDLTQYGLHGKRARALRAGLSAIIDGARPDA